MMRRLVPTLAEPLSLSLTRVEGGLFMPGAAVDLRFDRDAYLVGSWSGTDESAIPGITIPSLGSGTYLSSPDASGIVYPFTGAQIMRTNLGADIWEGRTNYFLNVASPATQNISVGTGTYTVIVVGSGSATSSAGTATGSGFGAATNGSPNTFTVSGAGTVTVTISGSPTYVNVQNGAFATPIILATGSAVTRNASTLSLAITAPAEGTLYVEGFQPTIFAASRSLLSLSDGTNANRLTLYRASVGNINSYVDGPGPAVTMVGPTASPGVKWRQAMSWSAAGVFGATNGQAQTNGGTPLPFDPSILTQLTIGNAYVGGVEWFSGTITRAVVLPFALSSADLARLTAQ